MRVSRKLVYLCASIALSLLFHLLFLLLTSKIHVNPGFLLEPPKIPSRTIKLGKVELLPRPREPEKKKRIAEFVPSHINKSIEKKSQPSEAPKVELLNAFEAKSGNDNKEKNASVKAPEFTTLLKPGKSPDIIAVDGDSLPKSRANFNRLIIPKIPRSSNSDGEGGNEEGGSGLTSGIAAIPLKMRGEPPKIPDAKTLSPDNKLLKPENAEILDSLMEIIISKHIDNTGAFFRIDIRPKQETKMPPFDKDIVFCIDVSGSISSDRLAEFKNGVSLALDRLNPGDRFDIVAFRHSPVPLFGEFRNPTNQNIAEAKLFLNKLLRTGSTNIFAAINPFATRQGKYGDCPERPLLMFLASDGMVNSGEVIDSRELINSFSNRNQATVSLYSFCTGKRTNSFLLDLLAYRNRGESIKAEGAENSGKELADFIFSFSELYVADLDYQISGNLIENTFPKKLPNLCKGRTLSLYGKYPANMKQIGIRITGRDSLGRKQELVCKADMDKAIEAGPELPKDWARQFIYNLYSRFTSEQDEKLIDKIINTAAEFQIEAPYYQQYLVKRRQ